MIHDIYNIYDNIIDQSNHSFGCLHSIEGYLRESLEKDLDITYDQFLDKNIKKLDFKKIKDLMKFIKNVPPCLDITTQVRDILMIELIHMMMLIIMNLH